MIALTLSGLLGRFLDRYLSWRITVEVDTALTAEGEDRVESLVQEIQQIILTPKSDGAQSPLDLQHSPVSLVLLKETGQLPQYWSIIPMDLAYTSLEKLPQQRQNKRRNQSFLSSLEHPVAPAGKEQLATLLAVQQAMRRERFYRSVIRSWRLVHIALALLTLGLTIWHIVYALQLLLPGLQTRFFV
jgi:hypothetical protein